MTGKQTGGRIALALQGGGSHSAFTWGVMDRLLEDGQRIDSICGVSPDAMIDVMLTQGGRAVAARR
jgi:NTE family protein